MVETKDLFAKSDLIPVIIQDRATKDILMLGYTNEEAYRKTLETHTAWFWSRSRQTLWNKGETSRQLPVCEENDHRLRYRYVALSL